VSIQLNRLKRVNAALDGVTNDLAATARRLEVSLNKMLAEGQSTGAVDVALARANIERLMVESGYYEVTGILLDTTYQSFIDDAHSAYQKQFGKSLQYSDVSLSRLDKIRSLDADNFNTIAADNINQLQKVMLDYQFGATDLKGASDRIAKIMGADFERYSEAVVRSTAAAFDREANNLMATDAGFDLYEFVGPDDGVTSDECQADIERGPQPWSYWETRYNEGGYPLTIYGNHVNCRHALVPVLSKEWNNG
jgi:hypothetical protein